MRVSATPTSGVIPSTPAAWATSRLLVVATGRILRMYDVDSTASDHNPLVLLEGHTAAITIVISLPGMRIASAGEDGTVRIWDVVTGQSLRIFDLAHPVLHMTYVSSDQLLCLTSKALLHVRFTRDRSKRRRQFVRKLLTGILSVPTRVVGCAAGSIIAVSDATNIHLTALGAGGVTTTLRCRRVVTALAITSDGKMLAVADESGVISLYLNPQKHLGSKCRSISLEEAIPSRLHWHAAAPQALAFAHDDSVLLSAGREAVLVTWRLSPTLFGTRTFLPRLRSSIFGISVSPDARMYAISQSDNAVRLVNQLSSDVVRAIRAVPTRLLEFSDQDPKAFLTTRVNPLNIKTCTVAQDPNHHGKLWFAGVGPSIQLFDVFSGSLEQEVQVIPRNSIFEGPRKDMDANGSSSIIVSGLAVHPSGRYLATVDSQDMRNLHSKRYGTDTAVYTLKFWRQETSEQSFVLDSVISQPHGSDCSVSSLCFHPKLPLLATASGASKTFKLWRATRSSGAGRSEWRSETEQDYKGMDCNGVCFSSDGSLLVVACEHILTMWHIEDLVSTTLNEFDGTSTFGLCQEGSPCSVDVEFLHALVHPPSEERIVSVAFVFKSVPLLIAVTRNGVYVWHALSQSIWWSTRIRSDSQKLAVDPYSGRFALQVVIPSVGTSAEDCEREPVKQTCTGHTTKVKVATEGEAPNPPSKSSKENTAVEQSLSDSFHQGDSTNRRMEADPYARCIDGIPQCTDAAVAIYDASSPVPLHIRRLATGARVSALSFVKYPAQTNQNSTLVCVDSRMEVFLYGTEDDTPFPSATGLADELRIKNLEPVGNLKMILGKGDKADLLGEGQTQELPSSVGYNILNSTVDKAFGTYFHGLTHVQAPAAVNSFAFVNALLTDDHERQRHQQELLLETDIPRNDEAGTYKLGEKSGPDASEGNSNAQVVRTRENSEHANSKAIRAFCVSLIRKAPALQVTD